VYLTFVRKNEARSIFGKTGQNRKKLRDLKEVLKNQSVQDSVLGSISDEQRCVVKGYSRALVHTR
jgi:predicted RNA binding protein with dsRBD fold (UPF0201 family)